jgi:hypothetical protein
MKFTVIGEIYCNANEARRMRARGRELEANGVYVDLSTHNELDRELVRHYPICATIRAYEIDREAFKRVTDDFALYPTDTENGGILGGDGGIGWTPAIVFEHEPDAYNGSFASGIYVTPWPETVRPITHGHDWERVKRAVINTFN